MRTRNKLVFGFGINDFNGNVKINGKLIKSYALWKSMLSRCYNDDYHKRFPTYIGCTVCEEWLSFSNFKKWIDENYIKDYHLDKDILFKGNKIYSPETCCFVPHKINTLFEKSNHSRGEYPIGVCFDKNINKFKSQVSINGYRKSGYYDTLNEAFESYKKSKETQIKSMAINFYNEGKITFEVYSKMIIYEVEYKD